MKRLILILAVVAALLAAAWLAPLLLENPGYVLLDIGPWRLEMSFLVLAGFILAAWAGASLALALARMPGRAWRRMREASTRRHLDQGLLALTEGDWPRAEKSLAKAMAGRGTTAGYLAAARAAQGQSAPERRDQWLQLAGGRFGKRHFVTGLARARLLAGEGRLAEAVPILEDLHLKKPRHPGVLRLLLQAYQESARWRELRMLVPALQRAGIVDADKAARMTSLAASRELDQAVDPADLIQVHASLRKHLRQEPEVVAAFARRALELNRPELAEGDLRRAIPAGFSSELIGLYADADEGDRRRRIAQCERWLEDQPNNGALNLALGKLYLADRDYDRARACLEVAVRERPEADAYAALGRVLDRAGELEAAAQCYRNALRLERGRVPEPLPPPQPAGTGNRKPETG